MREIKFRAWDSKEKLMWYNVQDAYDAISKTCKCSQDDAVFYPANFGEVLLDKNFVVMQFTGLCDNNGKEIYEGDVLRFEVHRGLKPIGDGEYVENWPNLGVVFWDSGYTGHPEASFNCTEVGGNNQPNCWMCAIKEVIGNIYENPELVEAK